MPDTADRWLLGDLQSIATGARTRSRREEVVLVYAGTSMHDVLHRHHVSAAATVMEGQQVQPLQSLLIGKLPELMNETCCPALDPLHQLHVGYIERAPDLVTVFEVWTNHGLVE